MSVTGEDLFEELRAAAAAARVSMQKFARPLFSDPNWKLQQLRIAKNPTPLTIERFRALIAGSEIPKGRPSNNKGVSVRNGDRRDAVESRIDPLELARRRNLAELAHVERLPGETLAAAVARLQRAAPLASVETKGEIDG